MSVEFVSQYNVYCKGDDVQRIDIRSEQVYEEGHAPEFKNVPLEELTSFDGDKEEPVYLMGETNNQTTMADAQLTDEGYDTYVVDGGFAGWKGRVE